MKKNIWKSTSMILIFILASSTFYFIIKGAINHNYIPLSKLNYGKKDILNNLLKMKGDVAKFKKKKIKITELSEALWAGYGKTRNNRKTVYTLLDYPLKLYVNVDNKDVDFLKKGLYEYHSDIHKLKKVNKENLKKNIKKVLNLGKNIPVILIITADDVAYQQDKEKVYFEAGQVFSQMVLKLKQLNLSMKLINEFDIEKIIDALNFKDDIPVMIFLIGKQ